MVRPRVVQVVRVRARRFGVIADDEGDETRASGDWIGSAGQIVSGLIEHGLGIVRDDAIRSGEHAVVELPARVDLEREARRSEYVRRQVLGIRVCHDQPGERIAFQLREEVKTRGAFEVVEAIAVLQALHLILEHEVERRSEQTAEGHLLLGESADPEVDAVESGRCGRAVQENETVLGRACFTEHDRRGGRALPGERVCGRDRRVRAVGGNEIHDRFGMFQVCREVEPARVRRELRVPRHVEELSTRLIECRHAGVAAAREIDGRQIERQPDQVIAQRLGHELVDLVADLPRHPASDRPGGFRRIIAARRERERVQERGDEPELMAASGLACMQRIGVDHVEARVIAVDRFRQHRVTEAVHHMREFRIDRGIQRGVVALTRNERIDLRLNGTRELFEDEMLVLHLGAEAGRLEEARAVPLEGCDLARCGGHRRHVDSQPLVQECEIVRCECDVLGVLDEPVVLGVEDLMDRGQSDVFVAASIARDEVRVEQLVVVRDLAAAVVRGDGVA